MDFAEHGSFNQESFETNSELPKPMHQCSVCNYSSNRKDYVTRHIRDVHENKRVICECGKKITASILQRHKTSSCALRKNFTKSSKKNETKTSENGNQSDETRGAICFNYTITSAEGNMVIDHDDIIINGIPMALVPRSMVANGIFGQGTYHVVSKKVLNFV